MENLHKSQIKNLQHTSKILISVNPQDCWLESPELGMSKPWDTGSSVCNRYCVNILKEELQNENKSHRDLSGGLSSWNKEIRISWARLVLAGWQHCLRFILRIFPKGQQSGDKETWAFLTRGHIAILAKTSQNLTSMGERWNWLIWNKSMERLLRMEGSFTDVCLFWGVSVFH